MRIRPLTIEDYEEMMSLWEAAGLSHRPKGRDGKSHIRREIDENSDLFLGAFRGETLIGTVIGTWDGRRGMINRLAVHPDHRGRGYAKMLIAACEEALRKHGAKLICALIDDDNRESLAVFERAGYTIADDIVYVSKRESPET
jgi:ribosomal protein S18 acetylase RimI-like enzyme